MTEPRLPRARRSWLAFGATTSALVLLASGGTAVLVQFGAAEGQDPGRALHTTTLPSVSPSATPDVTVDRVVGSFGVSTSGASAASAEHISLPQLLTPPSAVRPDPPAVDPPAPPLVPGAPPLPVVPAPQPTAPAIHPPVLPLPDPLPVPLPLPLPPLLPLPLPTIPLPPLPHL